MSWTAPIGIPTPSWGAIGNPIDAVKPSQPPSWPGSATSGYYYIDPQHPSAEDGSNTFGYPDKPRLTIPGTITGGAYVEVHGSYSANRSLYLYGTEANPIWICGIEGQEPTYSGTWTFYNCTYVMVEHIDFTGGTYGGLVIYTNNVSGTDHICVRHCKMHDKTYPGANTSGMSVDPGDNYTAQYIVFYDIEFYNLGDWQAETDQDYHAFAITTTNATTSTFIHHVWITDCLAYYCSGDLVQVVAAGNATQPLMNPTISYIYVCRNIGHDNRQASFWSKAASKVVFSQNIAYNQRSWGANTASGFGCQYNPDSIWYIYNLCYDSERGFKQSDSGSIEREHDIYLIGNVFHSIRPISGVHVPDSKWTEGMAIACVTDYNRRHIIDNTIYDVYDGITIGSQGTGAATISGNVISNINAAGWHLHVEASGTTITENRNCFHEPAADARVLWRGTKYTTLATYQAASGQGANSINSDPLMVAPGSGNFNLQSSSPCVSANTESSVYDTYYSMFGVSIEVDRNATARPVGAGWDIGAYEYDPASAGNKIVLGIRNA